MSISGVGSRELSIPSSSIGKEVGASRRMPRPDDTAFTGAAAGGGGRIGEGRVVERIEGVTAAADVAIALLHEERLVPSAAVLEGVESRPLKSLQERALILGTRMIDGFNTDGIDSGLFAHSLQVNYRDLVGHLELSDADRTFIEQIRALDGGALDEIDEIREIFIGCVAEGLGDIFQLDRTQEGAANPFEQAMRAVMIHYDRVKDTQVSVHPELMRVDRGEEFPGLTPMNVFRVMCALNDVEAEQKGISKDQADFDFYMTLKRFELLAPITSVSSAASGFVPDAIIPESPEEHTPAPQGTVGG
jgi:hypothetical protein